MLVAPHFDSYNWAYKKKKRYIQTLLGFEALLLPATSLGRLREHIHDDL
jgi:hypothetical protein